MYHISVLTGHQDEDDFGERLSDIAEVEYCSAEDEDELIDQLDGTDILICDDEPVSGRVLEETDDLKYNVMLNYSWGAPWDPHAYINAMATVAENGNPDYEAQLGLPMKKELDEKIHQVLVEANPEKVEQLYKEILTTLHEQAVYVPLTYQSLIAVYRDNLTGVRFMPQEYELPLSFIDKK